MLAFAELPLTIPQGCAYEFQLRQSEGNLIYRPVTEVAKTAPVRLTVPAHGLPPGWTVKGQGPDGASPLLSLGEQLITVIDTDHVDLNGVMSLNWDNYAGGMVLQAYKPLSFAGLTPKLEIKAAVDSPTALLTLTTQITVVDGLVTIGLTESNTLQLPKDGAVYRLTMRANASTEDQLLCYGRITLLPWVAVTA